MKPTSLYLCLITALSLLMACDQTSEPAVKTEEAPPTIEGVWTIEEMETVGRPDEGINSSPQPSLFFFTKQHYSVMFVSGIEPRPLFRTTTPSEKEIAAAYDVFGKCCMWQEYAEVNSLLMIQSGFKDIGGNHRNRHRTGLQQDI